MPTSAAAIIAYRMKGDILLVSCAAASTDQVHIPAPFIKHPGNCRASKQASDDMLTPAPVRQLQPSTLSGQLRLQPWMVASLPPPAGPQGSLPHKEREPRYSPAGGASSCQLPSAQWAKLCPGQSQPPFVVVGSEGNRMGPRKLQRCAVSHGHLSTYTCSGLFCCSFYSISAGIQKLLPSLPAEDATQRMSDKPPSSLPARSHAK